jgi:hypothetical protein
MTPQRLVRRSFSFHDLVLIGGLLTLLRLQMHIFAEDPGVGWHLLTGDYILRTWQIPRVDFILHSLLTRPWICDQWLSDLFLSAVFALGSWPLLYAVLTSFFLITFFVVLQRSVARATHTAIASSLASFVAFKLSTVHFVLRPVLFSFLLFTIVFACLLRLYLLLSTPKHEKFRQRYFDRLLIGLPCLFALWANLHPSFMLGLLLIASLLISLVLDVFMLGLRTHSERDSHKLLLLLVVCYLATLLTPFGYDLHESMFALLGSPYFMQLHDEWQSMNFKAPEGVLLQLSLGTIAISYLFKSSSAPRTRCFEVVPLLLFTFLAMGSVRMLPFAGIVASYPLALAFQRIAVFPRWRSIGPLQLVCNQIQILNTVQRGSHQGIVVAGFIAIWLVAHSLAFKEIPLYHRHYGPSQAAYPYAALDFLAARQRQQPALILAHPNFGGFISWYGQGKFKALIDDRNTLLGEDFVRDYLAAMEVSGDWRRYARDLGATYLLLQRASGLASHISQLYPQAVVYRNRGSILIELAKIPNQDPEEPQDSAAPL